MSGLLPVSVLVDQVFYHVLYEGEILLVAVMQHVDDILRNVVGVNLTDQEVIRRYVEHRADFAEKLDARVASAVLDG